MDRLQKCNPVLQGDEHSVLEGVSAPLLSDVGYNRKCVVALHGLNTRCLGRWLHNGRSEWVDLPLCACFNNCQ
jgi:hypothetical protein